MMATLCNRKGWTRAHLVMAFVAVALGVLATLPAWADIVYHVIRRSPDTGRLTLDEEASHALLVPLVFAWLVWVRRARFRFCQPRGQLVGTVLVALGWLISAWGFRNSVKVFYHGGAVMLTVGCLLSVVGKDVLMRFLPAFGVLVFLVPVPGSVRYQIAGPLQTATAQATQTIFEVLGEPVTRTSNQLSINGQAVNIIEACNGLRMVFTLMLVSYAFAFGEPLRHYVRLIILLASPLSAILCNVIRMIPTVWVYGYYQSMAETFHTWAGWVMLVPAFLILMGVIRVLRWAMLPVQHYVLASEGS
jgi:exosortase